MRICKKCTIEKPLDDYDTFKNKRKDKTYYRQTCKACILEQTKEWRANYNNMEATRIRMRTNALKRKYDMSLEDYDNMFKTQDGVCKICELPSDKLLHVDHCHITNVVRGLLCENCNLALGKFKDNIEYLRRAIEYLYQNQN